MKILQSIRPSFLFLALLTYLLGSGIAHYLGTTISWVSFFLGLFVLISLLAAGFLLEQYFSSSQYRQIPSETYQQRLRSRIQVLQSSFAVFTFIGVLVIIMLSLKEINWQSGILLLIAIILLLTYAIPPLSLSIRGYGEIILAILIGTFIPGFAFLLQEPEVHRLLPLITFPLTLLALAWLLAMNFSTYAVDSNVNRISLLRRVTWQHAIPLHHIIFLLAYLLFGVLPNIGIPWALIWPLFLAFPFALAQILWVQRIGGGGKPLWKFFSLLVPSVFGLQTYLLAAAFWMR